MRNKPVGSILSNTIIILLLSPLLLSASLFDFRTLEKAKTSYDEGNYSRAIEEYNSLAEKSDEVVYDEANSYYKLKEYEKAEALYTSIKKESLGFNKWHNLGNCHAQLGKIDEGIKAYEEALKIKEDEDTRFNLELLKKKKKEQEKKDDKNKEDKKDDKKKDDKNKEDKKDDKKKDDKNKEDKKDDKEKKESKEKNSDKDKSEEEKKKEKENNKNSEDKKSDEEKKQDKKAKQEEAQMKKEPISDKELRKYQKMLDQRGINTLMVPLKTEGENNDELKPW